MIFKRQLLKDIEEYIEWKSTNTASSLNDKMFLLYFAKFSKARDASDVYYDEVLKFKDNLFQRGTHFTAMAGMKALRCFLRYHRARKHYIVDERVFSLVG